MLAVIGVQAPISRVGGRSDDLQQDFRINHLDLIEIILNWS